MFRSSVLLATITVLLLAAFLAVRMRGSAPAAPAEPSPGMTVTLASATGPGPGRIVQYLVSYAGRQYFVSIETVQTHGGTKPRFSLEIQRFPPPAHGPVELMRPRPDFTSPRQALRSAEDRIRRGHWQGRI